MVKNRAYQFSAERVHIISLQNTTQMNFRCDSCQRDLPENQFAPLHSFKLPAHQYRARNMKMALHPICHLCREQQKGRWSTHPLYCPELDRSMSKMFTRLRAGAKTRGLVVAIEKDDLLGLYIKQRGKCALTGLDMDYKAIGYGQRDGRALTAPSADRINSNGNYVLGNVQMVLHAINLMKFDLNQGRFVKLCQCVAQHQKENTLLAAVSSDAA